MAFNKSKAAPFNAPTLGWIAANKERIRSHVCGNAKHFYAVTVVNMAMKPEDFLHFKGTSSKTVSGWVLFPTPDYSVTSSKLFEGWEHENLANGTTRINSIVLVEQLAWMFGIKPEFPVDTDAVRAENNLSFF